jgi:NDP-sugar pyrophosphorylase family protein
MTPPVHLLVPMSGQGARYRQAGYSEPKPLVPVSDIPMVERLLAHFPERWPAHFVLAENHRDTRLPALLARLRPGASVHFVPPHSLGPGHAILAALPAIPANEPVFVSYCDYGMVWDAAQFERFVAETGCDACVTCYRGFHPHYLGPNQYAYARLEGERVAEVREKGCFTGDREEEYASAGGYFFRTASLLGEALREQAATRLQLDGEYYTSLTVEALLRKLPDAHVRVFEISGFFQWGTPEDLQAFEYWERCFGAYNRAVAERGRVAQVLLPMAGLGSRFAKVTDLAKPLIPIFGRPMYQAALDSLPAAERTVLVALEHFAPQLARSVRPGTQIVALPQTPPGQALSTEAGLSRLDLAREVLVTACDHAIVLPASRWAAFRSGADCEAAIFTLKGFPGAVQRPLAYSYVVPQPGGGEFPAVLRVSLKRNPSVDPLQDHVLVGTFWFREARVLQLGIEELKRRDLRVGGELYLDAVFDCLRDLGMRVRMVPLEGYICWGEPDLLAEALYWQEFFTGRRIERRPRYPGVPVHAGG